MNRSHINFLGIIFVFLFPGFSLEARAFDRPDFSKVVEEASPAVVKIIVQFPGSATDGALRDLPDVPERLRRFFEPRGNFPPPRPERNSMGSGFVLTEDGYIVTNNHVVADSSEVLVRLSDRREFGAKIVGLDSTSDLALLKIDASNLPRLRLSSGDLRVGEWVLAIGSPFGLDYSVAAGIVSAKGRSLPTERGENYVPFIQTDVAINPGNSGGPLLNMQGEVAGVNSQIFTRSGGSIGLSFAIPSSVVKNVVEQLEDRGRVTRGWLGVTIQEVNKSLAESFGLDRPRGALISQLMPGGPAEKAGLQSGDIVLKVEENNIESRSDLPHVVGLLAPGTQVEIDLIRNGLEKTIVLEVGSRNADDDLAVISSEMDKGISSLGLTLEDTNQSDLDKYAIQGGVTVLAVVSGSSAADAGLTIGDVITLVGSIPITSVSSFKKAIEGLSSGQSVPVRLIRQGVYTFIGLKIPQ